MKLPWWEQSESAVLNTAEVTPASTNTRTANVTALVKRRQLLAVAVGRFSLTIYFEEHKCLP